MAARFTATEKSDLDNSMVAAQNVSLGTLLDELISASATLDSGIASGTLTPTAAVQPVATGLASVAEVVASLGAAPTINHMWVTATAGSVAGTIVISSFAPTNASTVTPVAASGSFVAVNWIARS